jgi:hypothetical protein
MQTKMASGPLLRKMPGCTLSCPAVASDRCHSHGSVPFGFAGWLVLKGRLCPGKALWFKYGHLASEPLSQHGALGFGF